MQCRPGARPRSATSASSGAPRRPDGDETDARSLRAVTGPTPQSCSTASGWRKSSCGGAGRRAARRASRPARDLGQELRPCDADRDRQAHPFADVLPQAARLSRSATRRAAPSRGRRGRLRRSRALPRAGGIVEDLEHRLARLRVGLHPRLARRSPPGSADAPRLRSSRFARPTPSPRSSPRARPSRPPPRAGREAADRLAARRRRRTSRRRRGGSSPALTRTYVLIFAGSRGAGIAASCGSLSRTTGLATGAFAACLVAAVPGHLRPTPRSAERSSRSRRRSRSARRRGERRSRTLPTRLQGGSHDV